MGLPRMQILTLALLILICGAALGADQKYVQARVKFDSVDQMMQLRGMHLDIMHVAPSFYEIVSVPEEIERLKDMGFEVEIIHDDMVAFYQSRFPDLKQTGYLTLSQVNAELNFDHILYPDIIESGGTKHSNIIKTHHNRVEGIKQLIEQQIIYTQFKKL